MPGKGKENRQRWWAGEGGAEGGSQSELAWLAVTKACDFSVVVFRAVS
jgi:hypothetical protein